MSHTEAEIKLTRFSKGSGCGCKIEPAVLEQILNRKEKDTLFSSLVAGYETRDDAAVWDLGNSKYLLSTTDFFTPIVDDPFEFGRISAANSLSDIYAMGGSPAFALALMGFPVNDLPVEIARLILDGAKSICQEAGIPLAGGHSIDIPEPVFGLVVNGFVSQQNLKKNNTGKEGDKLYLTKPLGTGIMSAALKREKINDVDLKRAIAVMSKLNSIGTHLGELQAVHSMTDVTGFGFLGHLIEMCEGSMLSARVDYKAIPHIEGLEKYTGQLIFPDNTYRNWNAYEKKVKGINGPAFITLCDPQTSGGLLFSASSDSQKEITDLFERHGLDAFIKPIGSLVSPQEFVVEVME